MSRPRPASGPTAGDRKCGRMRSRRAPNRAREFRDQAFCATKACEGPESAWQTAHSTAFSAISDSVLRRQADRLGGCARRCASRVVLRRNPASPSIRRQSAVDAICWLQGETERDTCRQLRAEGFRTGVHVGRILAGTGRVSACSARRNHGGRTSGLAFDAARPYHYPW